MKPKKNNPPKTRRRRACPAVAQPTRACRAVAERRRADCEPWRVDRPAPPLPSLYLPRKGREDISVPSVSSRSISAAISYDRRYNQQTEPSNYHPLSPNITSRAPSADRPPQTLDRGPQLRTARRAVAERKRACRAVAERRRMDCRTFLHHFCTVFASLSGLCFSQLTLPQPFPNMPIAAWCNSASLPFASICGSFPANPVREVAQRLPVA